MTILKSYVTTILALSCTAFGVWLRLAANDLAWPLEWSYSGPREDTIWAIREHAYEDIGLAILAFGLLIIILLLAQWLWSPTAATTQEKQG